MKQLSDDDILQMAGVEYTPDDTATQRTVRTELKLSKRIPPAPQLTPEHIVLDLHNKTVEQAWADIMAVATSGAKSANIITGASGVLRQLFPQWARESVLSPHIVDFRPINNGSFFVRFHHKKTGK
ncbi:MAG: Smr/MutS family protein [Alphaproteobacteria bacterium]|nr:Smr/MutS family protein [Alphaproteobacteria bacterium]